MCTTLVDTAGILLNQFDDGKTPSKVAFQEVCDICHSLLTLIERLNYPLVSLTFKNLF